MCRRQKSCGGYSPIYTKFVNNRLFELIVHPGTSSDVILRIRISSQIQIDPDTYSNFPETDYARALISVICSIYFLLLSFLEWCIMNPLSKMFFFVFR